MNIRKKIAFLTVLCIVGGAAPAVQDIFTESAIIANAEGNTYGDFIYEEKDDGTIEITGCSKDAVSVEIPSEIDGKTVTSIENFSFYDTKWLENKQAENPLVIVNNILIDGTTCERDVVIPESVTSIANYAFNGCVSLESVKLPESVINIGDWAFMRCESLKSIEIPENVECIGYCAFGNCISLESVVIHDGITNIFEHAFAYCENLKEIILPKSIKSIGWDAFFGFGNFKDVYYLGTEEEWNKIEFALCHGLENATIHYNYKPEDERTEILCGDANGDNAVNIADATAIVQFIANPDKYNLTEAQRTAADVCNPGDGVTPMDAYAIQLLEAGTIKSLPYNG